MSHEYKNTTKTDTWTVCTSQSVTHFATVPPGCVCTTGQEKQEAFAAADKVADKMIERYVVEKKTENLIRAGMLCMDLHEYEKAAVVFEDVWKAMENDDVLDYLEEAYKAAGNASGLESVKDRRKQDKQLEGDIQKRRI